MKQSPGLICLSRDNVSRATTLQDDKSSGGSPEDPYNPSTPPLQLYFWSRIQLYSICPKRPKFHKHWPLPEVLVFLHLQQYPKQSSSKPQTTSDILSKSFKSLKTMFLSLKTYCRSSRLHCKIHHQLNAQLWTEEQLEYHDSNRK